MIQETKKSAQQRRQEAKQRLQEMLKQRNLQQTSDTASQTTQTAPVAPATQPPTGINPVVDINLPNWSYSPNLRKFIDSLPGLAINPTPDDPNINQLGQYIPVAVPDTTTYPGSDYYEIALVEYREQMHSDLPPVVGNKTDPSAIGGTKLRGYVQLNGGDPVPHYMGPIIVARKGVPVRLKFVNMLPTGSGGDLFLPVDTTIMGSGMYHAEDAFGNMIMGEFTQNRSTVHLHGGLSPWISDGTPHQWITPAGEITDYPRGVGVQNVPDMPDPGPGAQTYYWTNEQSARLMFYHDHAWGITRLNVYTGVAAGYLLYDQVEEDLIAGTNVSGGNPTNAKVLPDLGGLYRHGIPLVIQDKSFVNDASTLPHASFPAGYTPTPLTAAVDPLWYTHVPGSDGGSLWFPHEYLPNENLFDSTGFWPMGRWDYGPWIIPPMFPMHDTLPSPSAVPEAFMDTMVVNGTAFPYVELPPTAIRLRILNACNDRMLNLQLYKADPDGFKVTDNFGRSWGTEVKMVPADPNPSFPTWPKDGRDGGVPNPTLAGPVMYQIGNESGFLAKVAEVPAQPIDYDYDRTSATFGSVSSVALFLPPAVRADVIVDLSQYQDGDTLILYNDAPAPMPLYDARYDIFTDDPGDRTTKGGVPTVPPGFGPNTRTIMQIRIKGTPTTAYDLPALQVVLPKAFAVGQDPILVPASAYNDAYGTSYPDIFAGIANESLNISGVTQSVVRVKTELPGSGYTSPPTVNFYGGGGSGAAATATLDGVTGVTVTASGSGYTSPPTVSIIGGGGTGAIASAILSGGVVTAIAITEPGSNYTTAPTVVITGGGGTGATAVATITIGSVGSIILTNPGSGYTQAPTIYLTGGGGMGAAAIAMLNGAMTLDGKALVEGMDMEYGRMNAVLGSVPNPLTPTVGAGPVLGASFYIDPPTEVLNPDETRLWRITHIGVDSHSLHFHLFEVQVINRVDWTNTIKPPYPDEIGWKETIRTNPFEDIIVALRPKVAKMKLPFGLPDSVRLLDPSMPINSVGHFQPVLPPIGIPAVAQITNVVTNFGWEYVWHCHLLGHEENDMMRPLIFNAPRELPSVPVLSAATVPGRINLTWTDPTPVDDALTPGNPANEIGFRIERADGTTGMFTPIGVAFANATTYADTTVIPNATYSYRIVVFNAAGEVVSNTVVHQAGGTAPAVPTNLRATITAVNYVILSWTDNADNEQGFYIERSIDNGTTWTQVGRTTANSTMFRNTGLTTKTPYLYRVLAYNVNGNSDYSNTLAVTTK
jgi:FtsP/CotA-like multicopper oxidase with cupredoxin domain